MSRSVPGSARCWRASALIEVAIERGAAGEQEGMVTWARWAAAVLYNGLGRYADGLAAARQASEHRQLNVLSLWALPELVEAAVRTGNGGPAGNALSRLAEWTQAGGTDWGLGTEARCRALLAEGAAAEPLYQEAIGRLGQTRIRPMLARTHLVYGEWLRRQRRPADARGPLRTAVQTLEEMGMEAFARRGRRELRAAGGTARKRAVTTTGELTGQETQIARLAADGLSNPEIGTRLFSSAPPYPAVEAPARRALGSAADHRSCSGVMGRDRMRRPVAWKTALAMAGATPTIATSPMPLTPMGFIGSGSPTKITSMSGTSALTATR
jgi:hypothetical protein